MKVWQVFILYVLIMCVLLFGCIYTLGNAINSVEKVGLKNIFSDVWEGTGKK